MKKLALLLLLLIPVLGFSQNNVLVDATLTASASYVIKSQSQSGPWSVAVIPGTVSGTTTVALQTTHDGTHWVNYPSYVADTIASDSVTMFYGEYCPFTLMRLYFTVGTAASAPVRAWYTFKK